MAGKPRIVSKKEPEACESKPPDEKEYDFVETYNTRRRKK